MKKRLLGLISLSVALIVVVPSLSSLAQQPPPAFEDALADLGRRLGRTIRLADFNNPTSRWEWRGIDFADSSLECPRPGEVVTPGRVIGYQFIFILRGVRYDYRVAFNDRSTLRLCTNPTGAIFEVTLPPRATANTQPPEVINAALADLGRRLELNLTFESFNNPRSRWSWRYREYTNSQLNCPRAGQAVDQIVTPGWQFIFVYQGRTFDYRVPLNDPSGLFLCSGG